MTEQHYIHLTCSAAKVCDDATVSWSLPSCIYPAANSWSAIDQAPVLFGVRSCDRKADGSALTQTLRSNALCSPSALTLSISVLGRKERRKGDGEREENDKGGKVE